MAQQALNHFAALSLMALIMALPPRIAAAAPVLVEHNAAGDFEAVTISIQNGLRANEMAIVRQIQFHDMLEVVGIESELAVTFETFHPRFGRVVYANDKAAFIELPLRIHVRETDDGVVIRYRTPSSIFADYNGLAGMGAELDGIFADIVAEAIKP